MSAKKQTFEQEIARLEEIVAALEKGDAPLADSLALFEEGTKLIAACSQELDAAEQKVVKLMKGPDGAPVELKPPSPNVTDTRLPGAVSRQLFKIFPCSSRATA